MINMDKHIWEGWTVGGFIEDLEPQLDMIQKGQSWKKPLTSKSEVVAWCKENQPYYKKSIKEVNDYFCKKYNLK